MKKAIPNKQESNANRATNNNISNNNNIYVNNMSNISYSNYLEILKTQKPNTSPYSEAIVSKILNKIITTIVSQKRVEELLSKEFNNHILSNSRKLIDSIIDEEFFHPDVNINIYSKKEDELIKDHNDISKQNNNDIKEFSQDIYNRRNYKFKTNSSSNSNRRSIDMNKLVLNSHHNNNINSNSNNNNIISSVNIKHKSKLFGELKYDDNFKSSINVVDQIQISRIKQTLISNFNKEVNKSNVLNNPCWDVRRDFDKLNNFSYLNIPTTPNIDTYASSIVKITKLPDSWDQEIKEDDEFKSSNKKEAGKLKLNSNTKQSWNKTKKNTVNLGNKSPENRNKSTLISPTKKSILGNNSNMLLNNNKNTTIQVKAKISKENVLELNNDSGLKKEEYKNNFGSRISGMMSEFEYEDFPYIEEKEDPYISELRLIKLAEIQKKQIEEVRLKEKEKQQLHLKLLEKDKKDIDGLKQTFDSKGNVINIKPYVPNNKNIYEIKGDVYDKEVKENIFKGVDVSKIEDTSLILKSGVNTKKANNNGGGGINKRASVGFSGVNSNSNNKETGLGGAGSNAGPGNSNFNINSSVISGGMNKKIANSGGKYDSLLNSGMKIGEKIIPVGSNYGIINPEVGVKLVEGGFSKEGDGNFQRKFGKYSIKEYQDQLLANSISNSKLVKFTEFKRGLNNMVHENQDLNYAINTKNIPQSRKSTLAPSNVNLLNLSNLDKIRETLNEDFNNNNNSFNDINNLSSDRRLEEDTTRRDNLGHKIHYNTRIGIKELSYNQGKNPLADKMLINIKGRENINSTMSYMFPSKEEEDQENILEKSLENIYSKIDYKAHNNKVRISKSTVKNNKFINILDQKLKVEDEYLKEKNFLNSSVYSNKDNNNNNKKAREKQAISVDTFNKNIINDSTWGVNNNTYNKEGKSVLKLPSYNLTKLNVLGLNKTQYNEESANSNNKNLNIAEITDIKSKKFSRNLFLRNSRISKAAHEIIKKENQSNYNLSSKAKKYLENNSMHLTSSMKVIKDLI